MRLVRGDVVTRTDDRQDTAEYYVCYQHDDRVVLRQPDWPEGHRVAASITQLQLVRGSDVFPRDSDPQPEPKPLLAQVVAYEQGELGYGEIVELFQRLVDTGLAWQLQGFYGRTARDFIESGEVTER